MTTPPPNLKPFFCSVEDLSFSVDICDGMATESVSVVNRSSFLSAVLWNNRPGKKFFSTDKVSLSSDTSVGQLMILSRA